MAFTFQMFKILSLANFAKLLFVAFGWVNYNSEKRERNFETKSHFSDRKNIKGNMNSKINPEEFHQISYLPLWTAAVAPDASL